MVSILDYEQAEDEQLMAAICLRDRAALEMLYARYIGPVYSLAMRRLRDSGAAEEVAQDTFFNVWQRASSYRRPRGNVTSWLFGIARNRTIDELRKRQRLYERVRYGVDLGRRPTEAREADPTEYAMAQCNGGRLRVALAELQPEQREVVVLAYYGGMTHTEISESLGQPLGTVKTRIRQGVKKLREMMMGDSANADV